MNAHYYGLNPDGSQQSVSSNEQKLTEKTFKGFTQLSFNGIYIATVKTEYLKTVREALENSFANGNASEKEI